LNVLKGSIFFVALCCVVGVSSCSFQMEVALLVLISIASGFAIGASLLKDPSSSQARQMDANAAEAQSILLNSLRQRGLGGDSPRDAGASSLKIDEILSSPMSIALLIAVGMILMFHPDYAGLGELATCGLPSFKTIGLVFSQYVCFVFAAAGIYINIVSRRKP
jgi:hypothetical protein